MRRQLMCIMVMGAMLVGLAARANAAEGRGSIRVTLDYGDEQVHDGEVTLYRVGQKGAGEYILTDSVGGGLIKAEDAQSPALAQWLAETVGEEGTPRILDADGIADFGDLETGLYLLLQSEETEGYASFHPFLIPMPWEGQWDLVVLPKIQEITTESPKTGQHPAPIIGAMGLVSAGLALVMCAEKFRRK